MATPSFRGVAKAQPGIQVLTIVLTAFRVRRFATPRNDNDRMAAAP